MAITYGEAKKLLRKYAGNAGSCDPKDLDIFVKKTLQYMLYSGEHGCERKFCFHATNGCFTLPYELETPLKVKIDGEVGSVWNRWFEYQSGLNLRDSWEAPDALLEEPNLYATVYDLPSCGARVGVLATQPEDAAAHVIIKGFDTTGREVFTYHNGERVVGEYLTVSPGRVTTSNVVFGKITAVTKSITRGYVNLLWVSEDHSRRGFLADYSPYETQPEYRRVRIVTSPCKGHHKVSVIGRIRLKDYYADDDKIPFDNYMALDIAGQFVNSNTNNDLQAAQLKDSQLTTLIERESNYKKVNTGNPIDIYRPLSLGAIRPLHAIGRAFRRYF